MSDILKVKSGNSWIGIPAITGSPGTPGTPGSPGPAGPGVAEGGTAGQLLKKSSSTDYDTEWGSINASDIGAASIDLGITGATAGNYAKVKTVDGSGKPTSWEYGTMTGGTSDYSDLTNKPQIEGVTLSGNKTAADLGLAKSSDIPSVPVQSVNSKTGAVVLTASDVGAGTYSKPSGGIPSSDLANAVQTSLGAADTAYQKPSTGIPATDLASAVQTSLGAADTAYQKPSTGIPASDIASGVIPTVPGAYTSDPAALGTASPGSATTWARGDHVHPKPTVADIGAGTYSKPSGGIPKTDLANAVQTSLGAADTAYQKPSTGIPASDLASGVIPTVPVAYTSNPEMDGTGSPGLSSNYARGDHTHPSDTSKINAPSSPGSGQFLKWNGSEWVAADEISFVTLTGTAVTQTGLDNTVYMCGELSDLTFTAPQSGICAIRFASGTTPTVLTLNGVVMPSDWEGTEANTIYEINILNGYGVYQSWEVSGS